MSWRAALAGGVAVIAATAAWMYTPPALAKDQITIDLASEPSSLDPQGQWNPDSYYVYRNIFDNVVTRDNAGEIVPQIATSWRRLSDTEVEFKLRDELYQVSFEPGAKTQVLVETSVSGQTGKKHPSVWIVEHPKSRIVAIAPGHDGAAHREANFRKLLANAVRWADGK